MILKRYKSNIDIYILVRVALIGCGTIGNTIAKAIDNKEINADLIAVFDNIKEQVVKLASMLNNKPVIIDSFEELLDYDIDIVVEAASQEALKSYARKLLVKYDLMVMSVGALLDEELFNDLYNISLKHNTRLYIPSGAIAGIDAIKSVKSLIDEIEITTTKSPKSLIDAPYIKLKGIDLNNLDKPRIVYEGYAREAVRYFPANVNVSATLSLAGIGADKTKVKIIADPNIKSNRHEIKAKGMFGEFIISVDNIPSPNNPKTSYLAVLSAIECLKSISSNIRIGT